MDTVHAGTSEIQPNIIGGMLTGLPEKLQPGWRSSRDGGSSRSKGSPVMNTITGPGAGTGAYWPERMAVMGSVVAARQEG